jgi:tetratricopeptide (TPR) repeat protein
MRRLVPHALALAVLAAATVSARAAEEGLAKSQEAASALARGNVQQAVAAYTEALTDTTIPNDRRAAILTDRGVAYTRLNQPKLAIDDFNRAIQLFPEYAAVYNNRGNTLLTLGLVQEAIKDFDRAILLAPGYAAAYNNRAGARMKLGREAEAIQDYTRAITLMPASAAPLNGRGRALLAQARPHAAMRDFTRAINADARFGAGYLARAEAKLRVERFDEAIEDLSRAVAFDANNAEIYVSRGYAYLTARNIAAAIKDFSRAIELAPQSAKAYAGRGLALAKIEAYEDAEADITRAIGADPQFADAYAYRAYVYKLTGQPELGMKEVEKAQKLDPNAAEMLWVKGEIEEALGRSDDAIKSLQRVVTLRSWHRDAMDALERLGAGVDVSGDTEVAGRGIDPWRVVTRSGRFYALSDEYPRLRVPLEMIGSGQPRLLEWEVKKAPFRGIGILRFHAGNLESPSGPVETEQVAILDLQQRSVAGLQLHREGSKVSNWTWDEGKVVIASADGVTDELVLRAKPQVAQAPRRVYDTGPVGFPAWVPWAQSPGWGAPPGYAQRQPPKKKPKTFFDLLLGN